MVVGRYEEKLRLGIKNSVFDLPLIREKQAIRQSWENSKNFLFIGNFSFAPNLDSIEWLLNDIRPLITQNLTGAKLRIVGSNMPDWLLDYRDQPSVEPLGHVKNLRKILSSTQIMLAPLRFGAGLKGKVLLSLGASIPCIGTSIAYEGFPRDSYSFEKLTANNPSEFLEIARNLISNPSQYKKFGEEG